MINEPIVIALNATTFTAIVIPVTNRYQPMAYFTDDSTGFIQSTDEAGTNPQTIDAPGAISLERAIVDETGVLLWAKAVAGTPNMNVILGVPGW